MTDQKAHAASILLVIQGVGMLSLDLWMGAGIGVVGWAAWYDWTHNHDPGNLALFGLVSVVQLVMLGASVGAAGFALIAAVRGLRGQTRQLRPASLLAATVSALYLPVAAVGGGCCVATLWSFPLVLALISFGLAKELAEDAAERRRFAG